MKTISRYIMTLALLLTAVTGAWAQSTLNVVELKVPDEWAKDHNPATAADLPGFKASTLAEAQAWTGAPAGGMAVLIYAFDGNKICFVLFSNGKAGVGSKTTFTKKAFFDQKSSGKYYYTADAIDVTPGSSANTWTFTMPGSDVVLTPIYAKAAAFATTGTEPEVKTLLPEAAEGVIAGTDASLIAEGTGIVALAGESTTVTQGTLMYAIGTSATQAPDLTDFSATVPTAENVADDGADVLVWYYIQGADAPDGEAATLDNTFDNTEPACLTVQVLTNKFDIQFTAANANTIQAGKATVKVGDEAAEVDAKGKLTGVKMNSKVTVTAKEGYKFRKVEVKKGIAPNTITVTWNKDDITGSGNTFTKDGVTVYANRPIDFYYKEFTRGGGFTTTLGNFTKIEVTAASCAAEGTGWTGDDTKKTWTGNAPSVRFNGNIIGRDNIKFVFTIEPTN